MGCDSQFDRLYETPQEVARNLQVANKQLREKLAIAEASLRGYEIFEGLYFCHYDSIGNDSMDAHDKVCNRPRQQG
jgi:hypothetical protein